MEETLLLAWYPISKWYDTESGKQELTDGRAREAVSRTTNTWPTLEQYYSVKMPKTRPRVYPRISAGTVCAMSPDIIAYSVYNPGEEAIAFLFSN
jgi:hypothetical protein